MSLSEMTYVPLNVFAQKKNPPHRAGFPIICLEKELQTKHFYAQASALCRAEIISTSCGKEVKVLRRSVSMPLVGLRSFLPLIFRRSLQKQPSVNALSRAEIISTNIQYAIDFYHRECVNALSRAEIISTRRHR